MAKTTSSTQDRDASPPFGSRFLTDESNVWSQNAWDHVEPPPERLAYVEEALQRQRSMPVDPLRQLKLNERPSKHWDTFYKSNTANFFKDRRWLRLEFPELDTATAEASGHVRILEVGCGAGNAAFPILESNRNPELEIIACDYSQQAVNLVKSNPKYTACHTGTIKASVWDLTSELLPDDVAPNSVDIVILVFVFSALHPNEWSAAVSNLHKLLRLNGKILFRDYGRNDLTQVRFKEDRLMQDNFYVRGDNTRVYFFDQDEVSAIFSGQHVGSDPNIPQTEEHAHEDFQSGQEHSVTNRDNKLSLVTQQIGVDRRLLINRKRKLKMYRVWIQAKFVKQHNLATSVMSAPEGPTRMV